MSEPVTSLRNIGPRCAEWLEQVGIHHADDLIQLGAATAYRELVMREIVKPHRMLLYALGGAVEGLDCMQLAAELKFQLEQDAGVEHIRKS